MIKKAITCFLLILAASCSKSPLPDEAFQLEVPPGFSVPELPEGIRLTAGKVNLGRKLFFEKILSGDSSTSCGSCHRPNLAFSDSVGLSSGVHNRVGKRNAPALFNLAWRNRFLRDGGIKGLTSVPLNVFADHTEFDIPLNQVVSRINVAPYYKAAFLREYQDTATLSSILESLAAFQLTLISGKSRYDNYVATGNPHILSEEERAGMELFMSERTACSDCHVPPLFSNNKAENNGLYEIYTDSGLQRITMLAADRGKFLVPALRNLPQTAPYMHNGSMNSLEEVIEHYNEGGKNHPNKNSLVRPLNLTETEKKSLLAFLRSLNDEDFSKNPLHLP